MYDSDEERELDIVGVPIKEISEKNDKYIFESKIGGKPVNINISEKKNSYG
jgi:hypothetical protein